MWAVPPVARSCADALALRACWCTAAWRSSRSTLHALPHRPQVPAERVAALEDALGSLGALGQDSVVFLLTPGHSPGHLVYLHAADGARVLLAGDAVTAIQPRVRLGGSAGAANATQARSRRGRAGRGAFAASPRGWGSGLRLSWLPEALAVVRRPPLSCRGSCCPSARCPRCQLSRWGCSPACSAWTGAPSLPLGGASHHEMVPRMMRMVPHPCQASARSLHAQACEKRHELPVRASVRAHLPSPPAAAAAGATPRTRADRSAAWPTQCTTTE